MCTIITRALFLKLSEILDDSISLNQTVFMGGRQILDASLITNEATENLRKSKEKGSVLKLDFDKSSLERVTISKNALILVQNFESISWLCINLNKSSLVGINVKDNIIKDFVEDIEHTR